MNDPLVSAQELWSLAPPVSGYELLVLMVAGLALLSVLRLVRLGVTRWPMSAHRRESAQRAVPVLEVLVWLLFLITAIAWLLQDFPLLRLGAIGVLALAFVGALWFWIRDYLSGLVLRGEGSLHLGSRLRVGTLDGVVREMGARSLELELAHGERVVMGYRVVREASIVRLQTSPLAGATTFAVDVPPGTSLAAAHRAAARAAMLQPWVPPASTPRTTRSEGGLQVTVRTLGPGREAEVEAAVRAAVAGLAAAPEG